MQTMHGVGTVKGNRKQMEAKLMSKRQQGFTLVELIVVIAIIGVLAAVAVPLISGFLSNSKERAYNNDKTQIQAAVDAFYSSPKNPRFLGKRQYPIKGIDATGTTTFYDGTATGTVSPSPGNPIRGQSGGNPTWTDDGNGVRDTTEEVLQTENEASTAGWHVVSVSRKVKAYRVDTRNYIIDMDKLTGSGSGQEQFLDGAPDSASRDNCTGCTGSYTYYVDANGKVDSLYVEYPILTEKGQQEGVYP